MCASGTTSASATTLLLVVASGEGNPTTPDVGIYQVEQDQPPPPQEQPKLATDGAGARSGNCANKDAVAFDVVRYRPSSEGLENHHGVLDVWAKWNVPGYRSRASDNPTMALTKDQHDATKTVYRDWLEERTGKRVGGRVDWTTVGPREIAALSVRLR